MAHQMNQLFLVDSNKRKEENTKFILKRFLKKLSKNFNSEQIDPLTHFYQAFYSDVLERKDFDSLYKYNKNTKTFVIKKVNKKSLKKFLVSKIIEKNWTYFLENILKDEY